MPETDPPVEEGSAPEYPGDVEFPEDEEAPEPDEGSVEDQDEEAPEEAEGAGDTPPEADDGVPDLSMFPEEHREAAKKYAKATGDARVSELTQSWQEKIKAAKQAADEATTAKQKLEEDEQAFTKDAPGYIRSLIAKAQESGLLVEQGPPDPGPFPDDPMDTEAVNQWAAAHEAKVKWDAEKLVEERTREQDKKLAPLESMLQQFQTVQQIKADQQNLKADDDEMAEIVKLFNEAQDRPAALKMLHELVRLRKASGKKKVAAAEAKKGTEERAGLPRTGSRRARPRPTGDHMKDTIRELEADGVEIPADL
jgi:hypothetical protein